MKRTCRAYPRKGDQEEETATLGLRTVYGSKEASLALCQRTGRSGVLLSSALRRGTTLDKGSLNSPEEPPLLGDLWLKRVPVTTPQEPVSQVEGKS